MKSFQLKVHAQGCAGKHAGSVLALRTALLATLMISGCSTVRYPSDIPPPAVISPVSVQNVPTANAGRARVDYVPGSRNKLLLSPAPVYVPAFDFEGSISDLCSKIAISVDWSYIRLSSLAARDELDAEGNSVNGDDEEGNVVSFRWLGGYYSDLKDRLAIVGVGNVLVDEFLICSGSFDLIRVIAPRLPDEKLAEIVRSKYVRLGGHLILFGLPAEVVRDRLVLRSLLEFPVFENLAMLELDIGTDPELIKAWIDGGGLPADYRIVGRSLVGSRHIVEYVKEMMRLTAVEQCQLFEWRMRGVDTTEIIEMLGVLPAHIFCVDGGLWNAFDRRGLISAYISAGAVSDVRLFLERHDPAPRPVIVEGLLITAAFEDSKNLALALRRTAGISATVFDAGVLATGQIGRWSGTLRAIWTKSEASSLYEFQAPGLLGEEIKLSQGQSVALDGGAVVDEAGNTRQIINRVDVGLNATLKITGRQGGYGVEYDLDVSSLAAAGDVVNKINRQGIAFIPSGASIVVLALESDIRTDEVGIISVGGGSSTSNIFLMLSIADGYLVEGDTAK